MSFRTAMLLLLLQVFTRSAHAYSGVIRHGPDTSVTETGTTVVFTCHTIGLASWVINGTLRNSQAYSELERKGFYFSENVIRWTPIQETNFTMRVNVSLEVNDTDIQCQTIGFDNQEVRSQTAKLIIGTPPLPPAPEVQLINATALRLSWEPPFTWSEYPLLNYTVRMHNTSHGEQFAWVHTIPATLTTYEVLSSESMISSSYHELVFSVMASNALGESSQGTVHGGFPVVPGEFNASHITYEVLFQQSDGSVLLEITFESPQVCPSAWYRITVTDNSGDIIISKAEHNLTSGVLVHEQITSNLSLNQNYLLNLVAETLAGSNTPFTLYFNTVFHLPCAGRSDTTRDTDFHIQPTTAVTSNTMVTSTMVITTALGASMALCILVAVIVGAICLSFCRRHRGHDKMDPDEELPKSIPPIVVSTINDGPVYDTVDTKHPKSQVEGPQCNDIPPRLPLFRKKSMIKEWVSEGEINKMAVSFYSELVPPTGDEYTIMKPASVGTMHLPRRKKSTTPMDPENDYVIINS